MGTTVNGRVAWVDLSTPDVGRARRFYGDLLGWDFRVQQTDMGDYVVAHAGGREVAGMMAPAAGTEASPSVWTTFVHVDDMEATLAAITEAGGRVEAVPFEIPGGARVAVVVDRTGAMFALISGGPTPDAAYFSEEPGAVCWVELMTSRVDDAIDFYGAVFGWSAETDSSGPLPYTVCRLDGRETGGIIGRPDHVPAEVPDSWSVYFTVDDCAHTERRATGLGGSVILASTPTPMGPFAVLADPMGAAFQVMQVDQPAKT